MRKLPQVVADGSGSLAKLLADASHGLFAVHPQRSKDPHANRTRHGPKSIGTGHGHCGVFGQLPSLEFVSFIVEDSFPSPPIIYKFLYKIFAFEWVRNMCLTGNAAIYCSCEKCLFWNEKQTTGEFICARLSMIRL